MVGRIVSTEKGALNTTNARIEVNEKLSYDLLFDDQFDFGTSILFPN